MDGDCLDNREKITSAISSLITELEMMKKGIAGKDKSRLRQIPQTRARSTLQTSQDKFMSRALPPPSPSARSNTSAARSPFPVIKAFPSRRSFFRAGDGITSITGFLPGEDCVCTMRALQAMGAEIEVHSP